MKRLILTAFLASLFMMCGYETANAQSFLKKVNKVLTNVQKGADEVIDALDGTTESDGQSSTTTTSTSRRAKDKSLRVENNIEGLKLKVKSCKLDEEDNAIIVFTLENLTDDNYRSTVYGGDCQVFDDEGNIYKGSKSIRFARGNEIIFDDSRFGLDLPGGLITKWQMKVYKVDPAASKLSLVKIELSGDRWGTIQINNLPISREGDEE